MIQTIPKLLSSIKKPDWRYVFKLTFFATLVILAALIFLAAESSRRIVAGLTVWDCPTPGRTPAEMGLAGYQTIRIQVQPDQTLTAWYIPSQNGAAILLLQGHWQARDGMLAEAGLLARRGYGILLLDPHPCAGPEVVHTMGRAEVQDVAAAITYLRQRPDVVDGKVGVLGFSMGGVIAVESAARIPEIQAVVAQGNFDDLARNITPRATQGSLAGDLLRRLIPFYYWYYTGHWPDQVKPVESVKRITPRPILFVAGEGEIEANRTLAQFEAAGQPKELWIVPQLGHGGYLTRWPAEYEQRVIDFFDRFLLESVD